MLWRADAVYDWPAAELCLRIPARLRAPHELNYLEQTWLTLSQNGWWLNTLTTMEQMDPIQLYKVGKRTSDKLTQLTALLQLSQSTKYRQAVTEEQRFKVWAHSLGLYHQGHASLDYRVRDAEVVKARLTEILEELESHVCSLESHMLHLTRKHSVPKRSDTHPSRNHTITIL